MNYYDSRSYNEILTDEEYMAQGFTAKEVPMIRRHDELFNMADECRTAEETAEMFHLSEVLGL